MIRITEELIRKRAEHNEGIIGTLEELSLHQEDIEKIEHLNNWCKKLQILYLQANQISKIENLNKLKELQYLNLAINNLETVENLERCESLTKLDLTLNFIGDLESVKSLKANIHLRDLYLTGNPCCDFDGYREYVVGHLTQLGSLDMKEITISERIKALQKLPSVEASVKESQEKYKKFRAQQKVRLERNSNSSLTDEEFWQTVGENCPETRLEIARRHQKTNKENHQLDVDGNSKKPLRMFDKNNKPLNINQAKLPFTFSDADPEMYVLDVAIYKYLDTNLIEVDVQPVYVKLTVKGKVFQMVLPEEVHVEKSTALRSQTTGHLVLKLPKLNYRATLLKTESKKEKCQGSQGREYLEVSGQKDDMDFSKIVDRKRTFEDNPEVPMLEYG